MPLTTREKLQEREASGDETAFFTFSIVASHKDDEKFPASTQGAISLLIDSGSPRQITPNRDKLFTVRTIDKPCTFRNQGQLRAKAVGQMRVRVGQEDSRVQRGAITLKGMIWVTGIPCRIVTYGNIRRKGGASVDSGIEQSYINLRSSGLQYRL